MYASVYLFFLFLLQNIDCGYPLAEAVLTWTHNLYFEQKEEKKNKKKKYPMNFLQMEKSLYIAWAYFRNGECCYLYNKLFMIKHFQTWLFALRNRYIVYLCIQTENSVVLSDSQTDKLKKFDSPIPLNLI